VKVGRIYDPPSADDGVRVLVDRLWPRGVTKQQARIDRWSREVAPSADLRRWYGHVPERFAEFADRYRAELEAAERRGAVTAIRELAAGGVVTLLTATKQLDLSHAVVLRDVLQAGR